MTGTHHSDILLRETYDHRRVFPWDPSAFGIPTETLVALSGRLRKEVEIVANQVVRQRIKDSPEWADSSDDDVWLPGVALRLKSRCR